MTATPDQTPILAGNRIPSGNGAQSSQHDKPRSLSSSAIGGIIAACVILVLLLLLLLAIVYIILRRRRQTPYISTSIDNPTYMTHQQLGIGMAPPPALPSPYYGDGVMAAAAPPNYDNVTWPSEKKIPLDGATTDFLSVDFSDKKELIDNDAFCGVDGIAVQFPADGTATYSTGTSNTEGNGIKLC